MTNTATVSRQRVSDDRCVNHAHEVFGLHFPMHLEPFVYDITSRLARAYNGGYWEFYALSNGGFYMAPYTDRIFQVTCENGFGGKLSGDALGITACLYAYSQLSFSGIDGFVEVCTQQYHWLREYMLEHPAAGEILRAID